LKGETVQQDWLVGEPTIGQETEMDRWIAWTKLAVSEETENEFWKFRCSPYRKEARNYTSSSLASNFSSSLIDRHHLYKSHGTHTVLHLALMESVLHAAVNSISTFVQTVSTIF
jgi:hypothetical protein